MDMKELSNCLPSWTRHVGAEGQTKNCRKLLWQRTFSEDYIFIISLLKERKKKTILKENTCFLITIWPVPFINSDHRNWRFAFSFSYLSCKAPRYIVYICYLLLQISEGRICPVLQGFCPLAFVPPTCHWQYVKPLESCSWQHPHFSMLHSQFPRKGWQTLVTFCINTCLLKLDFFFFFLAYNQTDYTPQSVIHGGQAAPEIDDTEE